MCILIASYARLCVFFCLAERRLRLKQANKDAEQEIAEYERQEMEKLDRTHPPISEKALENEKSQESHQADQYIAQIE